MTTKNKHPFNSLRVYQSMAATVRWGAAAAVDGSLWYPVILKHLKTGASFKKKVDAKNSMTKGHYNRKDSFGPASFTCVSDADVWGSGQELNPNKLVWIDEDHLPADAIANCQPLRLTAAQSARVIKGWATT